ncbi:DUF11 domain-containing protein, partial [Polaribacter sp. Z014]|uniref:DUF11 domain-containing protein n=1 Tax=Polaribacter sp. Z014 TaxID=2927126 RepID=UPI002021F264
TAAGTSPGTVITNTVTNAQDQTDSNTTLDDPMADITVEAADLVTVKTVSAATPSEEATIMYTIAVTNNGPNDATGVSLTDRLPSGVTYVSNDQGAAYNDGSGLWTIGTVANGDTAT